MSLRKWILIAVLLGMMAGCNNNWSSGDRVLVSKCSYDNPLTGPSRFDVVVFKFPQNPVDNNTPKNYIKRLLGLPGELLAIFFGRIYRWTPPEKDALPFADEKNPKIDKNDLWKFPFMHKDDAKSNERFEAGEFEIVRKSPQTMLALRRIVYDNDFQAKDLKGKLDRWNPDAKGSWKPDGQTGFSHDGKADAIDWLRYKHLLRPKGGLGGELKVDPELIADSLAYNNIKVRRGDQIVDNSPHHRHWVGDLMLECNVEVVEPKGEFYLELSKGVFRYQARWDLATGQCALLRIKDGKPEAKPLDVKDTSVKAPGNYMLRFANIDARLTVWVDRALPFEKGHDYDPPEVRKKNEKVSDKELLARRGPGANDLEPASIGSKAANVKVTHVRLWRDTYYITTANPGHDYDSTPESWSDPTPWNPDPGPNDKPAAWDPIRKSRFSTLYVQPGHYLCLGDNSQASSDSREWGTVPERLMLGRALVVYYPLDRIGMIR